MLLQKLVWEVETYGFIFHAYYFAAFLKEVCGGIFPFTPSCLVNGDCLKFYLIEFSYQTWLIAFVYKVDWMNCND